MDKNLFYSLLQHEKEFPQGYEEILINVLKLYPWSPHLNMLMLKSNMKHRESNYESLLARTSFLVPDRIRLYKYLHSLSEPKEEPKQDEVFVSSKNNEIEQINSEIFVEFSSENTCKMQPIAIVKEISESEKSKPAQTSTQEDLFRIIRERLAELENNRPAVQEKSAEHAETEEPKKSKLASNFDKIEKFIEENPSIKIDKNYESNVDLAEHRIIDNYEIVTETLAEIYVSQQQKEKAIEIFQKLILKIPEKRSYFADRIKDLQSK